MMRNEWLIRIALVFCLVYGAIAINDRPHEKFPFFTWDLFSQVPATRGGDYDVKLVSARGVKVALPVYFEDSKLNAGAQEIQAFYALQVLGRALRSGTQATATALRKNFESTYFTGLSAVRYQVVERIYDVRKRVDCSKCFSEVRVLGTYTSR
jgi:hypothetical protein